MTDRFEGQHLSFVHDSKSHYCRSCLQHHVVSMHRAQSSHYMHEKIKTSVVEKVSALFCGATGRRVSRFESRFDMHVVVGYLSQRIDSYVSNIVS